jgi:two-component system chemotaxis response regulator CheB
MPQSAIEFVDVDHVMRLTQIAALIQHEAGNGHARASYETQEVRVAHDEKQGRVSALTCPECNGALWELDEGGLLRFRCRIGHIYSPDSLLEQQADTVDRALWAARRSLQERAASCRKLSTQAVARGHHGSAEQFLKRAEEIDGHAVVLRDVISSRLPSLETPDSVAAPSPREEEEEASSKSR